MFVVQENHGPHKYTRIHKVGCSFARPNGHTTKNTRWYPRDPDGRLDRLHHAEKLAKVLRLPYGPFLCKRCFPEFALTRADEGKYRDCALELLEEPFGRLG